MRKNIPTEKYFYLLDLARFIAAIGVVLWHYKDLINIKTSNHIFWLDVLNPIMQRGFLGVQFFWMLSGFVISNTYFMNWKGNKIFFRNRFARLYPLHFVTLIIMLLLNFASIYTIGYVPIYGNFDFKHFILNLLFVSGFINDGFSFNGPIWSVSLELLCYLIFAVMQHLKIMTSQNIIKLLIGLLFVDFWQFIPDLIIRSNIYFFTGVFLNLCWRKRKYISLLVFISSFALANIIFTKIKLKITLENFQIDQYKWIWFFSSVIFLLILLEKKIFVSRNMLSLKKFGDNTYSVYLIHTPLNVGIIIISKVIGIRIDLLASNVFFLLFYFLLINFFAYHIFIHVESPIRKKIRFIQ